MTLRKSSNRNSTPFSGTLTLFASHLRQGWSALLVYSLIAVCVPLLSLLGISGSRVGEELYYIVTEPDGQLVFYIACGIAAMLAAAYTWRYLHDRKHNYFECKLPYRREALYTGSLLYGLVLFILPLLLMIGIFVGIGLATVPGAAAAKDSFLPDGAMRTYLLALLRYFLFSVASYTAFFSVFTLGAVICGHMAMSVGFSVYLLFFFVLFGLLNEELFRSITGLEIVSSRLLDILKISPINVYRWFGKFSEMTLGETALHCLWLTLGGLGILALGLLLHHIRKSERTGLAFAFPAVGQIFKFTVLYLTLAAIGLLIRDTAGSVLIGILLLAVIGFGGNLVLNMILQKNFRRGLFRGWKGLIILYVGVIVLYLLSEIRVPLLPSASSCESVTYGIVETDYEFYSYPRTICLKDKEDIERFCSYLKPYQTSRPEDEDDPEWWDSEKIRHVDVTYQLKNGMTVYAYAYGPADFGNILKREGLYTEAGMAESMRNLAAEVDRLSVASAYTYTSGTLSGKEARELLLCCIDEWETLYDLTAGFSEQKLAFTLHVNSYRGSYAYYEFPVFVDMEKTIMLMEHLMRDTVFSLESVLSDMIEATVALSWYGEDETSAYKIFLEGENGREHLRAFFDLLDEESVGDVCYTEVEWTVETGTNSYSASNYGAYDPEFFRELFGLGDEAVVMIS